MNIRIPPPVDNFVPDMNLSREVLFRRHRLSHQQINTFLEDQQHDLVLGEKISQLRQVARFLEITTALNKAGIWFVAYKGPLLSYRIYNDATCRRFKDFDFLIKPDEVLKTIAVLRRMGFIPRSFDWPVPKNREKRLLLFLNQFTLDHLSEEISIEIHWSLLKYPVVRQKKLAALVEKNIQQTVFSGQKFNQFTLEFELLHLVIHGGLHTWSRLKWLIDIHEIIDRFQIDWGNFEILINIFHAERLIGLCNGMLSRCFKTTSLLPFDFPIPDWFLNYSFQQLTRTSDTPVYLPKDFMTYRWFHIQAFSHWKYKIKKVFLFFVFYLLNKRRKLFKTTAARKPKLRFAGTEIK
jgi:hypothetical protein